MNRKICLMIIVIAGFLHQSLSAQPNTLWTKTYGGPESDNGSSVQQTSDGGYIIAGSTASFGAGSNDVWLIKTNASGDTLWTKTYGGSGSDVAISVLKADDGGYIITGPTTSFGEGSTDVWMIKTNASGDILWTKTYGGSEYDGPYSVVPTNDDGYIIIGTTRSFGAGKYDIWLMKTDASGDTLWTKTFGGSEDELGTSVQQTSDNGYIIAGSTYSFGAGYEDAWLIRTDAVGDTLWTKTFGGSQTDRFWSIQQTADQGFIITGFTRSYGAGGHDIWLVKTDASGDTLWTKTFGGSEDDWGYSVLQTEDGGYIISGYTKSFGAGLQDAWLIKTDAFGDTLWTKTYGGSENDHANSIYQTTDQGYIIIGYTESYGQGKRDLWLIRTAPDVPTAVTENNSAVPESYQLSQNYPNPFNPETTIHFTLPVESRVELNIYNMLGIKVRTLLAEKRTAGNYSVQWNRRNDSGALVSSGIYIYELVTSHFTQRKKMLLLK